MILHPNMHVHIVHKLCPICRDGTPASRFYINWWFCLEHYNEVSRTLDDYTADYVYLAIRRGVQLTWRGIPLT